MERGFRPASGRGRKFVNRAATVGRIASQVSTDCGVPVKIARGIRNNFRARFAAVCPALKNIEKAFGPSAGGAACEFEDCAATQGVAGRVGAEAGGAV